MLDVILDFIKKILKSRLFPITIIYLVLFAVVINRLFVLQIIKGPTIEVQNELKDMEQRDLDSTRGNIYDRNGKLLATNELSYSVVMQDINVSNEEFNSIIYKLVNLIEKNGNTLDTEFYIQKNKNGEFEFTVEGKDLTRFKKLAYTYVLKDNELTEEQQNASAKDVFEFLKNGTGDNFTNMFGISDQYTDEEALKIMNVRFAFLSNYPKYNLVTLASKVNDTTVAAVMENSAELKGVDVKQETSRVYEDSKYFAQIIGYTGKISAEQYENQKTKKYSTTDVVGKTGIENRYEEQLAGVKGKETVSVKSGKVIKVEDRVEPVAGNDIYLTIDADLQKNCYLLLEKEINKILLSSIVPDMNYGSKGESATDITIPIYEVYNALINNNVIDITAFQDSNATALEKETYIKYQVALKDVFSKLDGLLRMDSTTTNDKAGDMQDFLNYFYKELINQKILLKDSIPEDDKTFNDYKNNKISLSSFLQYALSNNWIDLTALNIGDEYYSAEELYQKLITNSKELLRQDDLFNKLIYRNLIFSYKLTGTEICLLLFDQGVLEYKEADVNSLKNGGISAYTFLRSKLSNLEITPEMLALDPCNGSIVITDVKTGEVLALVSYPGYDNNKLANKVDSQYYSQLLKNNSLPLTNFALKSRIAPGSTFKMVTSVTALEEGVVTPSEQIRDLGEFTKISPAAKCHIYPNTHGLVDIVDALKVSCNYFFYEMGWRLSMDNVGLYKPEIGLSKIAKYADLFGFNETSGIELDESPPKISDIDAVRSSIGQGSNYFTPAELSRYVTTIANRGTCFDLTLLDKVEDKDGNVILQNSAKVNHTLDNISKSTWDAVYNGMNAVVNTSGGSVEPLFRGFDVTVAGKTGTSQVSKVNPNNALFLSFAPYDAPEISVTAVIPRGYTSHNTAELCKKIYSLYFDKVDIQTLLNSYTESSSNTGAPLE